ncbi:MAG: ABC transporter permease [Pseudomonadota bacterium]
MSEPASASLADFEVIKDSEVWRIVASGSWTMAHIDIADTKLRELETESFPGILFDTNSVFQLDTSGAWLVERLRRAAQAQGATFQHIDGEVRHTRLTDVVREDETDTSPVLLEKTRLNQIEQIGRMMSGAGADFLTACYLIGASIQGAQMKRGHRGSVRINAVINQMDHMGVRAIPVIFVMSFLVGAIIAQQGAFQLSRFGAELLTVNLVGILHLREIGVLITAIMVAGRTGSAITAELGTMKMREEIDALQVMGLNPVGVLIFPRLLALIIVMPILTLLSDGAGLLGAMVVCALYLGITPDQFINALEVGIGSRHVFIGLVKAPFMALVIGLVAAVEGSKVGGSAESLGQRTTASVVKGIFLVILMDGLFAIFFAALGY